MRWLNTFRTPAGYIGVMLVLTLARPEHVYSAARQDREFDVAKMPAELAKDVDAVMRLDALNFVVEGPNQATMSVQQAITILNAKGRDFGQTAVGYDKFLQLSYLRGWLYDAGGRKIRELKKSDTKDYSAITDYSLYEDNRVRFAELYHEVYPYTVVYEYEVVFRGVINWPSWSPYMSRMPVERSRFEISAPAAMPIRYHLRDVTPAPQIQQIGARRVLRWEATSLPKWEREPYGPLARPVILTAPTAFEIADYAGDMSSWAAFGSWFYQLYQGRTTLPPPALTEIQSLFTNGVSPREKVRLLYEYLQAKTRYVSVQLGIGGWQPSPASYVYERGYGDCKALTNYMLTLLQAANVEAHPALIRHGDDAPVIADFPSNQFNHVILFVPMAQDTLWLECTSQTSPLGHLGAGNEDRNVLVVTPNGGKLMRTPRSKAADNQQIRRAVVTLTETGDATAEVRTRYTGNQQDHVRWALAKSTPREREDWLREEIEVPSFRLVSADFSDVDGKRLAITLPIKLELPRFASRSGMRLFLRPNLMERWQNVPPEVKARKQPVELDYTFLDTDTISYQLPANFIIEAAPPVVALETSFGSYKASIMLRDNTLEYARRLEIRESRLPATQYEAYRQFIADVVKADRAQIVLVRKIN
jgi:transglutaminase-like putative cysteine protease